MRMIFGLVLLVGLGLAGFAVYMAQGYINTYQEQLERERAARAAIVPTIDVFVVNRAVRYGDKLTKEDVRSVKWPQDAVPEGAFQTIEAIFPKGDEELRTVLRAMEKDEAVLEVKVTEPGEDAGVSSRLAKGMRAFAIRVDVASGVSGFLTPGDRVDVYWSGRAEMADGEAQEVTQLIQPGIRILAIDQSADSERDSPTVARTVTVEATPQQVASLAQAQSTGSLSLALVGTFDDETSEGVAMNQSDLLGIERTQVVQRERERVCTVRTRRGAEVVEIPIPCTN
ncbi:Flp pilus assembly protein CpaB [Palleronia sp. KMU-117]|uniref:Flp pilus assembly protein CpaB n=1 Tax=Palleronia sp. KMU-117 TaxID=3434108 RepID=UPI003D711553